MRRSFTTSTLAAPRLVPASVKNNASPRYTERLGVSQLRGRFTRSALSIALSAALASALATTMPAMAAENTINTTSSSSEAQLDTALDALRSKNTLEQDYKMMTPEQIEREIATFNSNDGFDAPIATLDSQQAPIGLDTSLDAAMLPTPSNLDTLNKLQDNKPQSESDNAEIMARPVQVSDSVSSGRVDQGQDITEQLDPNQALAQQQRDPVTGAKNPTSDIVTQADAQELALDNEAQNAPINPDDYLPDYQVESQTQAVSESIDQANKEKPRARNSEGLIKRTYNRLFNGGAISLPHVDTTVYLQQATNESGGAATRLIKADKDLQPMNNIKAALDETTVQSVVDFTAALPRLRQTALDAAKAVGYYDITLTLRQPNSDTIDVIIEKLGEPVRVDSRIIDVRGAGIEQEEYQTLESSLPPQEGEIFNHRVYKNSKAALEALSSTYGYFDQYWLNKSVDVILPDNTADVSLVYDTGDRYEFDEVVFFTYDAASNTLTSDPDKLPVELSLLQQLFEFEAGDAFYRPAITKLSNDLSATRYFNTVNVESILPPDSRSASSTLAFDNVSEQSDEGVIESDSDVSSNNGTPSSNRSINNTVNTNGTDDSTDDDTDVDSGNINADSSATVEQADIAPIDFKVDEETQEKLLAIKQKAERLISLPNNRVLDEKTQATDSLLGKISDSISNVAEKIFPDDKILIADESFVPPTLANRITPEQVFERKKVPLYVFVSSDKPRDAEVGIGYGTDTGVRATGKIDYNLINRQGYQAGAEVELSRIKKNATVYASRPWKHPLDDKLEARITYEEKTKDQGEGNFDLSVDTLQAALARNIRSENGWNQSYFIRYRLDDLEAGDKVDLGDLEAKFTSGKPEQKALLLGYGLNRSDTDNATNPTKGISQYYGIQAASGDILSDTDMAIINAGVSGLYSFGKDKKHQVLASLDTGYIWSDEFYEVPYELRFFAGGDQSIRGYDYESLSPLIKSSTSDKSYLTGGQILAVGSAEYNYEFIPGLRGAVFTDVGNAYDKDFDTDTKVGVGVGIRWASPVGVVRVDVAAGVSEESIPVRLHFFIGSPL